MEKYIIKKYLKNYGTDKIALIERNSSFIDKKLWDYGLCVPSCGENEFIEGFLKNIAKIAIKNNYKILVLVSVNNTDENRLQYSQSNKSTLDIIRNISVSCEDISDKPPIYICQYGSHVDLLILEQFEKPYLVPSKFGVGLVRKELSDLALYLIQSKKVSSPWIFHTDMDALLPLDYFELEEGCSSPEKSFSEPFDKISAYYCAANHIPNNLTVTNNMEGHYLYEKWLNYYVKGLNIAESPYSFPTIGSTLITHCDYYAKVRGFPKKPAGEDFYLLNKLRKIGFIKKKPGKSIKLYMRESDRVPFGTGQASKKIQDSLETYEVLHPDGFLLLQRALKEVKIFFQNKNYSRESLDCFTQKFSFHKNILIQSGLVKSMMIGIKYPHNSYWHFHEAFDGLKTLQFLNFAKSHYFGTMPVDKAIERIAKVKKR